MSILTHKIFQLSAAIVTTTIGISFAKPYHERKYTYPHDNHCELTDFVNDNNEEKSAIIIGGGVNGICNAFELHKKGYKTAIIDINNDVAEACSKATWGGMSTNYHIVDIGSVLFNKNRNENIKYNRFHPIYLNWKRIFFDLHFLRWGYTFLLHRNWIINKCKELNIFHKNELDIITQQNTIKHMTKFVKNAALYQINFIKNNKYIIDLSQQCQLNDNGFAVPIRDNDNKNCKYFQELFAQKDINNDGICEINNSIQKSVIYDVNKLSLKEIGCKIGDENLLTNLPHNQTIKFVKHSKSGHLADSPNFCRALKQYLTENNGLKFIGNTKVLDFDIDSKTKRISKIYTNKGIININNKNIIVVLSAGAWSPFLGRKLNLFIPVYPLKGFDFVIDYNPSNIKYNDYINNIPKHAIIDNHLLYVNYGTINDVNNRIRIACIGAFNGWNNNYFDKKLENILYSQGKEMMPNVMNNIFDKSSMNCVCGLRPFTYDVSIIVGKIRGYNNLYISVGPGYNGFKTSMGCAQLLSEIVVDNNTPNYFDPYKHNVKKSVLFCKLTDLLSRQ